MNPIVAPHAIVTDTQTLGAYRVLWFRAPEIARGAQPGQFVNVAPRPAGASLLRRPFSVYRVQGDDVSVVFDAIGDATRWLATRETGDSIDVVGPLGHGFDLPETPGVDLLIGGGYGGAAMSLLAERLTVAGGTAHVLLGARSLDRVFEDKPLEQSCASITVTTDDGSAGTKGIVTDVLPDLIRTTGARTVFACGPMRMLEAIAKTSSIPTQLAVEEFMACGIGVCWTCVLPVHANGATKHARSCTEGPVFDGTAVAWA